MLRMVNFYVMWFLPQLCVCLYTYVIEFGSITRKRHKLTYCQSMHMISGTHKLSEIHWLKFLDKMSLSLLHVNFLYGTWLEMSVNSEFSSFSPIPKLSVNKAYMFSTTTQSLCSSLPSWGPIPFVFRNSSSRKPASSWIRSSMLRFPIPKSRRMVREKRRRIFHRSPLARATPAGISVSGCCLLSPSCV